MPPCSPSSLIALIGQYLASHWRGTMPLPSAFWINFLGLLILAEAIHAALGTMFGSNPEGYFWVTVVHFVLFRTLLFPWQAVGLMRSSERALPQLHNPIWARAAQGAILVGVVVVFVDALGVFHAYYHAQMRQEMAAKASTPAPPAYRLEVIRNSRQIHLVGTIDLGITDALRTLLDNNPKVHSVILESPGGHIFEARGIAKIIVEEGLDTIVFGECSSSCATAFISGARRLMGPEAKIGFHRYRLDASFAGPNAQPDREFEKDLMYYRQRGVRTGLLAEAAETSWKDMWYPGHAVLLEAGVAHEIVDPGGASR